MSRVSKKRIAYDMVKGITIRYLPSNYTYESLLKSDGYDTIVKIMTYDITYNDPYQMSVLYIASSALGALKAITFNEEYASDNFTDGTLNLKTSSIFSYIVNRPVIKGMNIVLYTNIKYLRMQDNNIIFLCSIINDYYMFYNCNIIDLVNYKIYNDNLDCKSSIQEIHYIDRDGIIKTTAIGFIEGIKTKNVKKNICSSLLDIDNKSNVVWLSKTHKYINSILLFHSALDVIKNIVYREGCKTKVKSDTLYIGNSYCFFNTLYYLKRVLIDKNIIIYDNLEGDEIKDLCRCRIFLLTSSLPVKNCKDCIIF